jgi:hypothetical protein
MSENRTMRRIFELEKGEVTECWGKSIVSFLAVLQRNFGYIT